MSAHEKNIEGFNLPFRVPCPPPALRLPPKAYMTPPLTLSSTSKSIPSPPMGARFPGDRFAWPPMVFSDPQIATTMLETLEEEILRNDLDDLIVLDDEPACMTLEIDADCLGFIEESDPKSMAIEEQSTVIVGVPGNMAAQSDVSHWENCITFHIGNGQDVRAGDWIRDSVLGLGQVLKLYTHPDEPDRHRVWFVGQTEDGTVVEDHPLLPSTLGIIDKSMVPADIREAAQALDQDPQTPV